MHIKLLALDIDGTLVTTEKNIPAGNKTAIRRFMKNGGIVTIASGRPISGVTRYAEELGLNVGGGYIITYNGSRIFDARTGELLYEKNLSAEQSARIIDVAEKYNVPITTYKGDTAVTDNADDKYFYLEVNLNNLGLQRVPSLRKEVTYPVPKYLITGEPDYITETEKLFKNELRGVSVFRSEPFFLEITPLMVDKGTALMWLAAVSYTPLPTHETLRDRRYRTYVACRQSRYKARAGYGMRRRIQRYYNDKRSRYRCSYGECTGACEKRSRLCYSFQR